jgi:hypothetical protein
MIIGGIDPGQKGGIAWVSLTGEEYHVEPMPTEALLADVFRDWIKYRLRHVFVEQGQAMPWHSRSSSYHYGFHCGTLCGTLAALGVGYTLVRPTEWQKVIHQGTRGTSNGKKRDPKRRTLEAMRRHYPGEKFLATPRSTKPHDGMYDSLGIAEYGRRRFQGGC